jgi:hypothetical protein
MLAGKRGYALFLTKDIIYFPGKQATHSFHETLGFKSNWNKNK